ncbi:MAG TPA: hypothetical protein VMU54_09325 [Planctomycetota bacterium]|nr:hypothetical protein [Planctomycetota bacterium]
MSADDAEQPVLHVYDLCTDARSLDEVAFTYAHELGHLVLDHQRAYPGLRKLCDQACGTNYDDDAWWTCCDPLVAPTVNPQEFEADRYAFSLLSKKESRFNAAAGKALLLHTQDSRWALGKDGGPGSPRHAPPVQRAATIREWERERQRKAQNAVNALPSNPFSN